MSEVCSALGMVLVQVVRLVPLWVVVVGLIVVGAGFGIGLMVMLR